MSNPVFSSRAMEGNTTILSGEPMTINGAISKTFILFLCLLATSVYEFMLYAQGLTDKAAGLLMIGFVASIIAFIVIMFARKTIKYMAPVYALSEGLIIGGLSAMFEGMYPGIVVQAVGSTFMAFFVMLALYKAGIIKCSEKFRSVLMISMFSILGIYLVQFIGSFFHMSIPGLFTSSLVGIGFSAVVCIVAALNFIIDFNVIEEGANNMADKSFEWYGAFGLIVTFVWLYIEILNLLAKLRDR
ncbi:MAG: Bax inhibitor-1/YccA family protein [Candidatus Gastranaerophilaceae bacterium]